MKMMDKSTASVAIVLALAAVISFIGEPQGFAESSQAWISGLIGGLISAAGSAVGAAIGNRKAKQQAQANEKAWNEYEDWYQNEMDRNILDGADALSMLSYYRDWQNENAKKHQLGAIKGGASEEAKIAYAQQANKGYADIISRIAGMGQQHKDRLTQNFARTKLDFQTKQADMAGAGAQAVASGVANAAGALGSMIGGMNWGGVKPQKDLLPSLPSPTSTTMKIDGSGGVSPIGTSDFYFGQ